MLSLEIQLTTSVKPLIRSPMNDFSRSQAHPTSIVSLVKDYK